MKFKLKNIVEKIKVKPDEENSQSNHGDELDAYQLYDDSEAAATASVAVEYDEESDLNTVNQDIVSKRAEILMPKTFNDVKYIVDELKKNRVVLVDLSKLEKSEKRRMIDFIAGVIYISNGTQKKIESEIYKIIIRK